MTESWLVVETSGKVGRVGVARGGAVVRAADLDAGRRHARDLTGVIHASLRAEGLRPADLAGVLVGVGPGSYTGLRVGVMTAKALSYALGCRLVAVPTFAAVAAQAPADVADLWVIADALQGHIYAQRFARTGAGGMDAAGELRIVPFADWAPGDAWVSGPGLGVYGGRLPAGCRAVPDGLREPTVGGVWAAGRGLAPVSRDELFRLEPLYLRGSSAEEKARQAAGPG